MGTFKTLLTVAALMLPTMMRGQTSTNTQAATEATARTSMPAGQVSSEQAVNAELRNTVDSKHAKVGDQITAVTREQSVLNGTKLPKGTTLTGHITDVAAHSKSNATGSLGMVFDQARLKDGTTIPIHTTLRGLAPSPNAQAAAQSDMDMGAAAATRGVDTSAGMQGSTAARGGGLLGGARSTVGGIANDTGAIAGSTVRGVGQTVGAVGGTAASGMSSIPGVNLSAGADATTSGMVSAQGRDVRLDDGTRMSLGISTR